MEYAAAGFDRFVEIRAPRGTLDISILMPVCNQKEYIAAALSSVLAQEGVTAEIILSDDGSRDGTFEEALRGIAEWLEKNECAHRIVVRRGKKRLWRDHLALLAEHASCDIVCQAHGDDLSVEERCSKVLGVFREDPLVSLVASESVSFAGTATPALPKKSGVQETRIQRFTTAHLIDAHRCLVGSLLAWRKSATARFMRLDTRFSATSHDRILVFRASLAGTVMLIKEPLVYRRIHKRQMSRLMYHEPLSDNGFGWSLVRMTALNGMMRDLEQAAYLGLIDGERKSRLEEEIGRRMEKFRDKLIESFQFYTCYGQHLAWVDEQTLHRIRDNRLDSCTMLNRFSAPLLAVFWRAKVGFLRIAGRLISKFHR